MTDSAKHEGNETTIVVACMDRRLPGYLMDKYNGAIFVRNAAADVKAVEGTLKELINDHKGESIRLHIVSHEDCGGCKVAFATKGGQHFGSQVDQLGARFWGVQFSSQAELEHKNPGIQEKEAKEMFPGVTVTSEYVSKAQMQGDAYHGEKRLVVISPGATDYNKLMKSLKGEVGSFYVVQGHYDELVPDIVTAVSLLGVQKVDFVLKDEAERAKVSKNMGEFLKLRLPGIVPESVRIVPPFKETAQPRRKVTS